MSLYELIDLAKRAKEMGLVEWGFLHRPSPGGYFHMITAMFGGEFVDEKTGKLIIDTDALLKNFKFHRYLVENGFLPKDMTKTNRWKHFSFMGRVRRLNILTSMLILVYVYERHDGAISI